MTVEKLIDELLKLPAEMDVTIWDHERFVYCSEFNLHRERVVPTETGFYRDAEDDEDAQRIIMLL